MGFLQIPGLGKVHYHEYGSGDKPMLAFHGYGMTGKQFHVLKESVLTKYHVYGFDHFFHGESELEGWTEKQILEGMPRSYGKSLPGGMVQNSWQTKSIADGLFHRRQFGADISWKNILT